MSLKLDTDCVLLPVSSVVDGSASSALAEALKVSILMDLLAFNTSFPEAGSLMSTLLFELLDEKYVDVF